MVTNDGVPALKPLSYNVILNFLENPYTPENINICIRAHACTHTLTPNVNSLSYTLSLTYVLSLQLRKCYIFNFMSFNNEAGCIEIKVLRGRCGGGRVEGGGSEMLWNVIINNSCPTNKTFNCYLHKSVPLRFKLYSTKITKRARHIPRFQHNYFNKIRLNVVEKIFCSNKASVAMLHHLSVVYFDHYVWQC